MDKKGFWALLASVSKAWKTLFTRTNDSFRYRQAAGDDNILLPEKNGRAVLNTVYGNTVKWNQLFHAMNSLTSEGIITEYNSETHLISITNVNRETNYSSGSTRKPVITSNELLVGHKYYIKPNKNIAGISFYNNSTTGESYNSNSSYINTHSVKGNIVMRITGGYDFVNEHPIGDVCSFYLKIIDLTDLFGAGNEPSTVAEVEQWLALNVGTQDYYPYDAGGLISFKGQGVKSVGFNQMEENFQQGFWSITADDTFTSPSYHTQRICSVNPIKCFPNTQYYLQTPKNGNNYWGVRISYTDVNKICVGGMNYTNGTPQEFTTPNNCYYLHVSLLKAVDGAAQNITPSSYENNICINLSDATKNGTYEPYKEDILNLDVTKVYGKVSGEGSYMQCYPNGMLSAGDVHDTFTASEAVVKVGSVDLGTLNWTLKYSTNTKGWSATIPGGLKGFTKMSAICSSYVYNKDIGYNGGDIDNNLYEKIAYKRGSSYFSVLIINDSSYTDAATFKTAMNGVMLYYELETPITYTDLIYSEDGGVTGTPLKELAYKVDKYSTEELLVPANVNGEPTSTAIVADIDYQITGQ